MAKYCSECGTKLDEEVKFCPECGNKLSKEIETPKSSPTKKPEYKHNIIMAIGYLIVGLISLFLGVFGLYNREALVDIMYFGVEGMLFGSIVFYTYLPVSILFIWFALFIIAMFGIYSRKKYGRNVGTIGCVVGIITSFFLYWGGIGLVFLIIFVVLLIMTKTYWKKLI